MSSINFLNQVEIFPDTSRLRAESSKSKSVKSFDSAISVFKNTNPVSDQNGNSFSMYSILATADSNQEKANAKEWIISIKSGQVQKILPIDLLWII